jgi:hypothetical protein
MAASDPLHLIGATLARKYLIESVVRMEASTVIYRGTHLRSSRSVGVRVIAGVSALPEARRRSLAEQLARDHATLAELAQIIPAAYPLRDVGTVRTPQGNAPFVVLDWPHGITLRQMVQPETGAGASLPESLDEVVAMLEPVAVALAIAHENGVVHGGITSDRVLFREDGPEGARRATLLDFGVASVLRAIDGGSEATPADDVRALAAILAQVMARSCGADARLDDERTPRERGVVVTSDVEEVFARALGPETYRTVGELWSTLRRALGLASLRSLEATLPPESRPLASTSLRPLARSTPPSAARAAWEPIVYSVATFALLVGGGLTIARAHRGAASAPREAVAFEAHRPCAQGMVAAGGENVRLGQASDADEPVHEVTLRPFCIDRDAVTTAAYKACSDRGECAEASRTNEWEGIGPDDHDVLDAFCTARDPEGQASHPANCVTWEMARTFCAKAGGRLPTEAEWELASRSTAASIAEWVSDWRAPIGTGPAIDPAGPASGDERVVRGAHAPGAVPTRFGATPATRSHAIGFRCVKAP